MEFSVAIRGPMSVRRPTRWGSDVFSNNMNNQWLRGFTASLLIFALTGCAELAYLLDNADQSAGLALGTDGLYAGYSAGYAGSYYGSSAIDPFYGSNTTYCYLGRENAGML